MFFSKSTFSARNRSLIYAPSRQRSRWDVGEHVSHYFTSLKEFLANEIGEESLQWMLDAGARLRRDYSSCFRQSGLRKPESSQRPWLVGLTKEEALAHPGSDIAGLFIYTPPRFHFNRSQRMLLQHAFMGETCETVATSLSLSPWTVKKRWRAIYDRVADVDREVLPPSTAYGAHVSSRGAERRRHLLNYLRQHLEELRPYQPPKHRIAHIKPRRLRTRFGQPPR